MNAGFVSNVRQQINQPLLDLIAHSTELLQFVCRWCLFLVVGLTVGALSGVVGIGGGILVILVLMYGFGMSQHKAQGTSLGALLAPIRLLVFLEY